MRILETNSEALYAIGERFGSRLQRNAPLSRYTAARLGGPADALLEVHAVDELVEVVERCWRSEARFFILGAGSNVLVSDAGMRELVVINRAREIRFDLESDPPSVWAESGANFGLMARQAAARGLAGLEWAAGIPGTLGGAIVGNAGAHGGDMRMSLDLAEILHRRDVGQAALPRREEWQVDRFEYSYRSSVLKRQPGTAVVLSAQLSLQRGSPEVIQARIEDLVAYRHKTQPPGASMGSMFKNPAGDFAGRLIEAAGLKGKQEGGAQISPLHANFFINQGDATAQDVYELISIARQSVSEKFGVDLELEVELLGEW
jgi:UDP-N-acetylmuramate dehydrogenase